MFESIPEAQPDKIFAVMERFKADPRPHKMSLIAGIFCDDEGRVPILSSVKKAETELLATEISKDYLLIEGEQSYQHHVLELLGLQATDPRYGVLHTPGGTGALHVIALFLQAQFPHSTVFVSAPTWPNHPHIFKMAGFQIAEYRYYDKAQKTICFDAVIEDLKQAKERDIVLFHACCHNPSGADFTQEQWQLLSALVQAKQLIPVFDCAYQGFANNLQDDAYAIRLFAEMGIECLVASSFSKNFGLYNERVGALTVCAASSTSRDHVYSQLKILARGVYSNPPAHGGHIVDKILGSDLKSMWHADLIHMKNRLQAMRALLAERLSAALQTDYQYMLHQYGLFSFVNLSPAQVERMMSEQAVYLLTTGRINVASVNHWNVDRFCEALKAVS